MKVSGFVMLFDQKLFTSIVSSYKRIEGEKKKEHQIWGEILYMTGISMLERTNEQTKQAHKKYFKQK